VSGRGRILTPLELEIMRVVWDAAPEAVTAREVVDRLNAVRSKALAYNTVQTMLTILREKGVLASRPGKGRAHLHRARLAAPEF
jgi:predicted transcriptional regulator